MSATDRSASMIPSTGPSLEDRVLGSVPVTGRAFAKLLDLLSIEACDSVPSACVTTGTRSRLLINPAFVARHCRSDEHLAMLVMHELYHVLLGHTRLYPRVTPAQNWAFDCLINAQLCRLFPEPRYTSFFGQFVSRLRGPARLLAPPSGWLAGFGAGASAATGNLSADADAYGPARLILQTTHWRLYSDESIGATELFRLLEQAGNGVGDGDGVDATPTATATEPPAMPLLGNHRDDADDSLHPEVLREVRDIVARWPMIERRSGRDQGGDPDLLRLSPGERLDRAVSVLRRAVAAAAGASGAGTAQRRDLTTTDVATPLDTGGDRRAQLLRMLGAEPLLFAGRLPARGVAPIDRVHVYLDVSGSMDAVLPALYAALAGCLDAVEPTVHGFSTAIGSLTHAQLRDGVRLTTGGTDIGSVTGHLLQHGVRRALIVTDGWVGSIPADHLKRMQRHRVRLAVVVTTPGDDAFAKPLNPPVFRLPELSR
jgi:hypothetical protein